MGPIISVNLCGGSGSRLWPLSRAGFRTQFLALTGHNTLFQKAVERTMALAVASRSCIRASVDGGRMFRRIHADSPVTGYGCIRYKNTFDPCGPCPVVCLTEMPDVEAATSFLQAACSTWDSGFFVFKANLWLRALHHFMEEIVTAIKRPWDVRPTDVAFIRPDSARLTAVPSDSIEFVVLESYPGTALVVKMAPLEAGWSGLGAWEAVWQARTKDSCGDAKHRNVLIDDTHGMLIYASSRAVSVCGVSHLFVVVTADAVLIANRAQTQHVKRLAATMKQKDRQALNVHRKVHRAGGSTNFVPTTGSLLRTGPR